MRDFKSELNETIAKKHLHLLWGKTGPYERLVSLRTQLAPTEATRSRELAVKYANPKTLASDI